MQSLFPCCRQSLNAVPKQQISRPGALLFVRCQNVVLHSTEIKRHAHQSTRVAVLYQALEPPIINGVRKPPKPGGYQDSGADIAYNLQTQHGVQVITPYESPDPAGHTNWCFPDTEEGILSALEKGATHLWANTILFASHPLQNSQSVGKYQDQVNVIGQPPTLVEQFDDKNCVNELLRSSGSFTMPKAWTISDTGNISATISALCLPYPVVGKPVRGRGSHGVKVCKSQEELVEHMNTLFKESPTIMIEEYLAGEEVTVTVMPPSAGRPDYWSMPIVTRFNHENGIAPYNGVVAVTSNSRVVKKEDFAKDPNYNTASQECGAVSKLLQLTAPIRIDIRRFKDDSASKFALFDVNMKPNMTGPGRPGRENQASLTAMAARELGWDYPRLLEEMLKCSFSLRHIRNIRPGIK